MQFYVYFKHILLFFKLFPNFVFNSCLSIVKMLIKKVQNSSIHFVAMLIYYSLAIENQILYNDIS